MKKMEELFNTPDYVRMILCHIRKGQRTPLYFVNKLFRKECKRIDWYEWHIAEENREPFPKQIINSFSSKLVTEGKKSLIFWTLKTFKTFKFNIDDLFQAFYSKKTRSDDKEALMKIILSNSTIDFINIFKLQKRIRLLRYLREKQSLDSKGQYIVALRFIFSKEIKWAVACPSGEKINSKNEDTKKYFLQGDGNKQRAIDNYTLSAYKLIK